VLRNVQDMDYADVEKGIAALGEKAKKNELAVEDMDGGTFTIRSAIFLRNLWSQDYNRLITR
jgi:pyruvate/2-oxoglutarate dehydrogenase complex dihydrolipoamide acyltransferase (E2) component